MQNLVETGGTGVASIGLSMVQSLTRAEIDQQISTAHQYPRSITNVMRSIMTLVTGSLESAEKCTYALPRGGKPITGPSIRLAEIVAGRWGNCRVGARVVHVDRHEMYVEAEGIFHDLETNSAVTSRVRRRISDRNGNCFNDDMIIVTGNAACSIAKRNAIFGGVPEAVWGEAYKAALSTIKGDVKTLPERRSAAMKAMAAFGLSPEQVYQIIGVEGEKDVGLEHLVIIGGMHSALVNEETTVEELLATVETDASSRWNKRRQNGGKARDPQPKAKDKAKSDDAVDDKSKVKSEDKPKPEPEPKAKATDQPKSEAKKESAPAADEEAPDVPEEWSGPVSAFKYQMENAETEEEVDALANAYAEEIAVAQKECPAAHTAMEKVIAETRDRFKEAE